MVYFFFSRANVKEKSFKSQLILADIYRDTILYKNNYHKFKSTFSSLFYLK